MSANFKYSILQFVKEVQKQNFRLKEFAAVKNSIFIEDIEGDEKQTFVN